MIKRILVALSGTPFTPSAVQHALELARRHDAVVTGVTLVDLERLSEVGPVPIGGGAAAHALAEHRIHVTEDRVEEQIKAFQVACREADVTQHVERETGGVFEALTRLWRYHDLTIFGLRGLFEYGVVENPDDQIAKLIARGIRPIIAVASEHRPIRRAVIAYNGSLESAKAMKRFVQMRPFGNVSLKIVAVGLESEAETLLADATTYCRAHGYEPEAEHVAGKAREVLLESARDWNADLLVMGSTSRHRLLSTILGRTVHRALREAEIPLFLAQ